MKEGRVVSIAISDRKGEKKRVVREACLLEDVGLEHDAHAEGGDRQVSILMEESIERMIEQGVQVQHGDFAENIVVRGLGLRDLKVSDRLKLGADAELRVTKIGKECLSPCRIYYAVGYCIMPLEGIFCRVEKTGTIRTGDTAVVLPSAYP